MYGYFNVYVIPNWMTFTLNYIKKRSFHKIENFDLPINSTSWNTVQDTGRDDMHHRIYSATFR